MSILVCPGIHPRVLTQNFLASLQSCEQFLCTDWLIFPTQNYPAYSAFDVLSYLQKQVGDPGQASPVLFIGFSAGAVGAIGAATAWRLQSGRVKGVIAIDGWGVPLLGLSSHRLSHDYFTHWSSALLGTGSDSFYADPPVEHLALWRSPQTAEGWWESPGCKIRCSAAQFLIALLRRYEEI